MAEILITGGAGNFGRTLANALRKKGHGLRIFDLPSCDFDYFHGWEQTRIFRGDILEPTSMDEILDGVEIIFHLAAILPPASEVDREMTFRVNVDGTRNLVNACVSSDTTKRLIFSSSVSVYGDTSEEKEIIGPDHPVNPNDWYAESKVEAEQIIMESGLPFENLRISGIVIPAFLDPPEPWPFTHDQRIELLALGDLVKAMVTLVGVESISHGTLLLAGGRSWQVSGEDYVRRWGETMDIPLEDMEFQDRPGWLNWYDTSESQTLLNYQKTSLDGFFKELEKAVEEALA